MEQESTGNKNQKVIAGFIVILAVVLIALGASMFANKKDTSDTSNTTPTSSVAGNNTSTGSSNNGSSSSSEFKDGTYSASGDYISPGGQELINVTVTLKDGTVTDSSVQQTANNRDSEQYQADFKQNYKSQIVGKKVSDINLSHVSGSSLTSEGFNEALEKIRNQAKA